MFYFGGPRCTAHRLRPDSAVAQKPGLAGITWFLNIKEMRSPFFHLERSPPYHCEIPFRKNQTQPRSLGCCWRMGASPPSDFRFRRRPPMSCAGATRQGGRRGNDPTIRNQCFSPLPAPFRKNLVLSQFASEW